jgi:hypothetical protein
MIVNLCAPNTDALNFIENNKTDCSDTIIVGDFNNPFSSIDRLSRPKKSTKKFQR